jgi:hypothetical protein
MPPVLSSGLVLGVAAIILGVVVGDVFIFLCGLILGGASLAVIIFNLRRNRID